MRNRYFRNKDGSPDIKAIVYEQEDHGISPSDIDPEAKKICARLRNNAYEAYVVGGAVRDLLLGKHPKDFDIATNAVPGQVRQIFSNSRIIGRRFRLVHIYFPNKSIHEVATFRAAQSGNGKHLYGTLYEDVMRRDFSINALYYNPQDGTIIDFIGGVKDIQKRIINSVLPLENSFSEDPVRMLRAVKYAALSDMRLAPAVGRRIKKQASLISTASISRLGEELNKIFRSHNTEGIFRLMDKYGILAPLFPNMDKIFVQEGSSLKKLFFTSLSKIDQMEVGNKSENCGFVLRYMMEPILIASGTLNDESIYSDVILLLKNLILPIIQPNRCVEEAVRLMFVDRSLKVPRNNKHAGIKGESRTGFRRKRRRRTAEAIL